MGIEDLILRLKIKFGNKLSEKIANSSRAKKKNVMEQAVNSYNKNNKKSLLWKGKELSRSSMANVLSIVRLSIQSKIGKKKKQGSERKP